MYGREVRRAAVATGGGPPPPEPEADIMKIYFILYQKSGDGLEGRKNHILPLPPKVGEQL